MKNTIDSFYSHDKTPRPDNLSKENLYSLEENSTFGKRS